MASLLQDPTVLRLVYGAILRNPIITDERYVDGRDVDALKQFQRSWARHEIDITTNWWKLTRKSVEAPNTERNPWAPERDAERFVRESDKYGSYAPLAGFAQASIQTMGARMETLKRESDGLRNELRGANEQIDDLYQRIKSLRDENDHYRKSSSQITVNRSEMSRMRKEVLEKRDRIRELEGHNQRLMAELSRRQAQDMLKVESSEVNSNTASQQMPSRDSDDVPISPVWVTKEYQRLLTQDWLAAKNAFYQYASCAGVTEQLRCEILSTVLVSACQKAQNVLAELKQGILTMLQSATEFGNNTVSARDAFLSTPRFAGGKVEKWFQKPLHDLSDEFEAALSKELRLRAENVDVSEWVQEILGEELHKYPMLSYEAKLDILRSPKVLSYVERGCALAWQMTIQRPLMYVTCDGVARPCDPNRHEVASTDSNYVGASVAFFLRPTLYQGDTVVLRGKVHTLNHFSKHL